MKTILLCACVLFASCGGNTGRQRVRIAIGGPGLQTWCLPVVLAEQLGHYKEEGVEVKLDPVASVAKSMQAVIGASVDMGVVNYAQTIEVAAQGQRVQAFYVIVGKLVDLLVVSPGAEGRIQKPEQLKGRLVGVSSPGSSTH